MVVYKLNQEMKSVLLQDLDSTKTLLRLASQLLEEDHGGETMLQANFPVPDNIPDQAAPQAMENFK